MLHCMRRLKCNFTGHRISFKVSECSPHTKTSRASIQFRLRRAGMESSLSLEKNVAWVWKPEEFAAASPGWRHLSLCAVHKPSLPASQADVLAVAACFVCATTCAVVLTVGVVHALSTHFMFSLIWMIRRPIVLWIFYWSQGLASGLQLTVGQQTWLRRCWSTSPSLENKVEMKWSGCSETNPNPNPRHNWTSSGCLPKSWRDAAVKDGDGRSESLTALHKRLFCCPDIVVQLHTWHNAGTDVVKMKEGMTRPLFLFESDTKITIQ